MESGRYWVIMKSGRKFLVEEFGDKNHVQWGDIDPATKKLNKVKIKDVEEINEENSLIKKERGFKNICFLEPGTSPLAYIDALDDSGLERIEMAAQGAHRITEMFEEELCKYTGAPYCVCVDNASNALFLALYYELWAKLRGGTKSLFAQLDGWMKITIPKHTYPSVACEIIHAEAKINFEDSTPLLKGEYQLKPTNVWDSALRFTANMYRPGMHQCISFTGAFKHLKLGKGGAILTDDPNAYKWFKKARFSGRDECSYHDDDFDKDKIIGWNFYMMPEIAARGLLLMPQFYNRDGSKKSNPDLELTYPDLSKFKCYR